MSSQSASGSPLPPTILMDAAEHISSSYEEEYDEERSSDRGFIDDDEDGSSGSSGLSVQSRQRRMVRRIVDSSSDEDAPAPPAPRAGNPLARQLRAVNDRGVRPKRFQMMGAQYFLTYSKYDGTSDQLHEALKERLADKKDAKKNNLVILFMVIGMEKHQDGDPHAHVLIAFGASFRVSGQETFDVIVDGTKYHPNIQTVKGKDGKKNIFNYVTKDGDFTIYGASAQTVATWCGSKAAGEMDIMLTDILDGKLNLFDAIYQRPTWMVQNLQKVRQAVTFVRNRPTELEGWSDLTVKHCECPDCAEVELDVTQIEDLDFIVNWFNRWMAMDPKEQRVPARPIRSKCLWLWGEGGIGKTTFMSKVGLKISTLAMCVQENFDAGWENWVFRLAHFDEFNGQRPLTYMNSFCDGSKMALRTKGGESMKEQNIPVIVTSNFTPDQAYQNAARIQVNALADRFRVVEVTKKMMHSLVFTEKAVAQEIEIIDLI